MPKKIFIISIILGIILTPCFFYFPKPNNLHDLTSSSAVYAAGAEAINDLEVRHICATNLTRPLTDSMGHLRTQTLTVDKSPYYFTGAVSLAKSNVLTIEPGVVIKVSDEYFYEWYMYPVTFSISGKIIAQGTETNPIVFTSIYDDSYCGDSNGDGAATAPKPGSWGGWQILSGNNIFDHVIMKYGGDYKRGLMVLYANTGNQITNSVFENNLRGMDFRVASSSNPAIIENNVFFNNAGGVMAFYKTANPVIRYNDIYNNKGGIVVSDYATPLINYNNIYNNGGYGAAVNQYYNLTQPVNAQFNWWGHESGPYHPTLNPQGKGDKVSDKILFDPWIGKIKKKDPVIIVPGIMGSYLYNQSGEEVWPNIIKMGLPGDDSYLNELILSSDGYPDNSKIYPNNIIRKILVKDYWKSLIIELENNGYEEGKNLFVFPYDWRLDIDYLAGHGAADNPDTLANKIQEILNQTNAEKVDIIAHSMGGLVAKRYMQIFGTSSVNKFIDIATPHLGAPKAFKTLMYGDNMNISFMGLGLNPQRIYHISQNMPSIYELLPSLNYFDPGHIDYNNYIADVYDLDSNGVKGNLNYNQTIEFMKNTGRNEYLLNFNDSLHNEIDNYSPQQDNIATYNIIGCGNPTIGKIYVLNKEKHGGYEYGLKYINGDSTVPLRSAETLLADQTYYASETEHPYLPSADGVRQLITSILKNEQNNFTFSQYNNLSQEKNNCGFSGAQISFHSPIELHVYDENNNHLGPDANGDIETGIEGAQYDIIEGNKFAFLPEGHIYKIIGKATDTGSFNARIQNIENGEYARTVYYNEVPLETASTTVQFEVNNNQEDYGMEVDQDGDQIFEAEFQPSSILNQAESEDLEKPETEIIVTGEQNIEGKYINSVLVELIARDNEDGSGILKTEYSLDNGQTWVIYEEPFILNQAGEQTILYSSTDRAGNIEEVKEFAIAIKIINIASVIEEIEMFYNEDMITKKMVEQQLINKLNWIQKYIERYGKKEIRREKIFDRVLEKCEQRKLENWCEEKLGGKFDKTDYKLNQIHQKIVIKQYQIILQLLKLYNNKRWISDWAYAIIKEDIEYLINNLE